MAQLLHHQDSAFYGKELHGCRWGILQFFGFRRRLRSTKMLSDKRHGQEKNSRGSRRRSSSYAPLKNEDSAILDDEENTEVYQVTKKQKASKRNSGKSSLRSLILTKLYGKEGQKEKMLPVAPKLLRTISIHYLESNEYVLDGESTSSGDGSSNSTKPPMQNAGDMMNLHHATSSVPDGCGVDSSSSLLLKIDDVRTKRKKSHRSISMDGILHKVPYGKKVSGDVISEGLPRSASATYDRDGAKPYFGGAAAKRHANQGFRRSRSLSESWENYSRLLDSISSGESKRTLASSKSTRDHSLDGPVASTSLQRTSEALRSQGLGKRDENLVTAEDALAPHVQEKTGEVAKGQSSSDTMVAGGSENPALPDEHVDDKAEENTCAAPSPSEAVGISEEQAVSRDGNSQTPSPEVGIPEEHSAEAYDDGDGQIHSSTQAADAYAALSSEETTVSEERTPVSHGNQTHPFHTSEPTEGTLLDLDPRVVHSNDADASTGIAAVEQESGFDGLQVDPRHETEFRYVKEIFRKSSFSTETLFDEWCSQNISVLQEADCQHYEAAAASYDLSADMSAEQLLLFDLTNEGLLDIYRRHSVSRSRLSWFSSFDRPRPVGSRALGELWSGLSLRLDGRRPRASVHVDAVLSSDLAKSDPWTDFPRGAERLGSRLADSVFDELLAELVLQLAEL